MTSAQVRSTAESPVMAEHTRVVMELLDGVQRLDLRIEKDAGGRLARVITGGVATIINYDSSAQIDSFDTNGRTTKVRLASDRNSDTIVRFWDCSGTELQPVDLRGIGVPQSLIDSIIGDAIFPPAEMIDPKAFGALEPQLAIERAARGLANGLSPKLHGEKIKSQFVGNGDIPLFTPQCTYISYARQSLDLNRCDFDDNAQLGICGVGSLGLAEVPPVALGAVIVCTGISKYELYTCKNQAIQKRFECVSKCS